MKTPLGTVLPTARSLRIGDECFEAKRSADCDFASSHPVLSGCDIVQSGGEIRYYLKPGCYAVVSNRRILWFETRSDGDYAIKAPK